MFRVEERDRVRDLVLALGRDDPRVTGGAVTGSGAAWAEDRFSDVDVAFGIAAESSAEVVLEEWTSRLADDLRFVDHFDLRAGAAIYRVFLLPDGLELDLAVMPAADFGAVAPTFRLVFGTSSTLPPAAPPPADQLIGLGWHHALHARAAIERGRPWLAEHWISALRDHTLALACLRHGLPAVYARGIDTLDPLLTGPYEGTLVASLAPAELRRAREAVVARFLGEVRAARPQLAGPLALALDEEPPAL